MRTCSRRSLFVPIALLSAFVLAAAGWATAQGEGPFTDASMDGIYAFVAGLGAAAGAPAPTSVQWLVVSYNGDGTADILTIGRNLTGEADADGVVSREPTLAWPETPPRVTYEMNPDGTFLVSNADGDVLWDGLIVNAEAVDGAMVATEYILFHRQPDPTTGALLVGRGFRQRER